MTAVFEKKIAEYEEELRISKEEGQKKQHLLDMFLNPKIVEVRGGVQLSDLNLEIPEAPQIKVDPEPQIKEEPGEQGIKQEQEPREIVAETRAVKTEGSAKAVKTKRALKGKIFYPERFILSDSEEDGQNSSDISGDENWTPGYRKSGHSRQWLSKSTTTNDLHIAKRRKQSL